MKNFGLNLNLVNTVSPRKSGGAGVNWEATARQAKKDFEFYAEQEFQKKFANTAFSCYVTLCGWTGYGEDLIKQACPVCKSKVFKRRFLNVEGA